MIEQASLYVWQLIVDLTLYRCTLHDSRNESGYLKDFLLPKAYLFLPFSKGQGEGEKCKAYQWSRGEGLKPDKPKHLEILLMLRRWKESPNKREPETYLAEPHS